MLRRRRRRCAEPAVLPKNLAANPVLSRWIARRPGRHGSSFQVGKVELGQGILTALAQIAADELGCRPGATSGCCRPTRRRAGRGRDRGQPVDHDSGPALRAAARQRARAVRRPRPGLAGRPKHRDRRRRTLQRRRPRISYGELAGRVDLEVRPTPACAGRARAAALVGTTSPRLDLPDKVARPAALHPGPALAGPAVRPGAAAALPGARLVDVDAEVAGDRRAPWSGTARSSASSARTRPPCCGPPSAVRAKRRLGRARHAAGRGRPGRVPARRPARDDRRRRRRRHDGTAARPGSRTTVSATYSRPFIAHASIAPELRGRALAPGRPGRGVVAQPGHRATSAGPIAGALGLDPATVAGATHVEGAGCYGHNAADDAAFDAVLLARAVPGTPVQVLWSRQDELAWAPFGSAMSADVATIVDAAGRLSVVAVRRLQPGPQRPARVRGRARPARRDHAGRARPRYPAAVDPPLANGAGSTRNALPGYDLPNRRVTGHRLTESPIRTSAMRSLGALPQCVRDRVVHGRGRRGSRRRSGGVPAGASAATNAAARCCGWRPRRPAGDRAVPEGRGLGVGYARYKGTGAYCAVVAEVEAEAEVRVRRLIIAVDVGRAVNPDGVATRSRAAPSSRRAGPSWSGSASTGAGSPASTGSAIRSCGSRQVPAVEVELIAPARPPSLGAGEAAQGPTGGRDRQRGRRRGRRARP